MNPQAKPLRPRWQKPPAPPQTVIQVTGPGARHMSRALAAKAAADEQIRPPSAFRYRHQMIPFAWGFAVTVVALAFHAAHRPALWGVLLGAAGGVALILFTRHLSGFAGSAGLIMGTLTVLLLPLAAAFGPSPWLPVIAAATAVMAVAYARAYRIRSPAVPAGPSKDEAIWTELAEHKRWHGHLGKPQKVAAGVRYPIQMDGIHSHIGDVTSAPLSVAAAWHKPITEAYVEPSPDGIASRGYLTILTQGTLQQTRHWDGNGVSDQGLAVIGRFADGGNTRIRVFAPADGARHSLIAGTTGSGKSALLDLLIRIYLTSGIYPVILDPQNGQSLPEWRGRVLYAAGADECMELLTLLHQGMMDRSRRLAARKWVSHGRTVQGMKFFDAKLTGWPMVRGLFDEHPVLLTDRRYGADAAAMTGEIGKLGRKAGVGEDVVAHVPSVTELADQVVRSMLVGGNVIGLRTGDRVSAGMAGLPSDPYDLPRQFPDGQPTYGLGYVIGPDNRKAIARTDVPTDEQMAADYPLPALEPEFAAILSRFGSRFSLTDALTGITDDELPGALENAARLQMVADSNSAAGQSAADAVLAVLTGPMDRGLIIKLAQEKSLEWGRDRPFSLKAVSDALKKLRDDGRVSQDAERGPYSPVRPSLRIAGGTK